MLKTSLNYDVKHFVLLLEILFIRIYVLNLSAYCSKYIFSYVIVHFPVAKKYFSEGNKVSQASRYT